MLSYAVLASDTINGRALGVVAAGLTGLAVVAFLIALVMAAFFRSKEQ